MKESGLTATACVIAVALAAWGCRPDRAGEAEVVYALSPPTWFEDGWSYYEVSPDRRWALFGARFGLRLIDLERGVEEGARYRASLDAVRDAVFDHAGRLVRLGEVQGELGWFAESPGGVERLPIPADVVPRWPRDGSRVAYFWRGGTELWIGAAGDTSRYATDGVVTGAAWSPSGDAAYALVFHRDGTSSLVEVMPATGSVRTVRAGLDAPPRFNSIAFSPDGQVAYLALASGAVPDAEARHRPDADRDTDIYALVLRTGRLNAVVTEAGDDFYPLVIGDRLYWTHNDFRDEVVVVPVSGGDAGVVVREAQIPYWSHDGKQLAFTYGVWRIADWALNLDAGVVDVDDGARAVSGRRPIVVGYHEDFTPAWSADGRWLAYHSHRADRAVAAYGAEGSTDDIYLRRTGAAATEEIRLTDFGWEVGMADWSPDGRRLVFDSWDRGRVAGIAKPWIATIDPESGRLTGLERLPLPVGVSGTLLAAWSPAGDEIAVVARVAGTRQALWVLVVDGGRAEKLVEFESATYGGLDWTPDAGRLVYAALVDGRMQLFAVPRAGGAPEQLTRDPVGLIHPQVSPDGHWIAATRPYREKALRVRAYTTAMAQENVTKYVRYIHEGRVSYGVLQGETVRELAGGLFTSAKPTDKTVQLAEVRLLAPCEPSNVIAVGLNYRSHLGDRPVPEYPGLFAKFPTSIVGPGDSIVIPPDSRSLHYEGELVIVIGRRAKNVSVEAASEYVFGVTAGNDVSERTWQGVDLQWIRAKASDTFGPIGPVIARGVDYNDLLIQTRVNGEVRQSERSSDLIFGVDEIVSYISRYITLLPGDVIFTGTPGRTGELSPGDVVEVEIEGVGVLRNPVVAAESAGRASK